MEQDVEDRLRQKFTMIDKADTAAIAAAQQVILLNTIGSTVIIMHIAGKQ